MTSEEKDQLLDRYVTGQPMSVEEEALVDQLLTTDPDFRAEYRLQTELFEFGKRERRANWEARQKVHSSPEERTVFPMRWAAAASVLLVLGLGLVWWLRSGEAQTHGGKMALFEQHDGQLGLTETGQSPVDSIGWTLTKAARNQYVFEHSNSLKIFTSTPDQWQGQPLRMIRLSEVRYRLQVGKRTYLLEQGRSILLPLDPEK